MTKIFLFLILCVTSLAWSQTTINGSRWITGYINTCVSTGNTANTYVCTMGTDIASYTAGAEYSFIATLANTGAATMNINGVGAVNIVKYVGGEAQALIANDIRAGAVVVLRYDGTNFQIVSLTGNVGSSYTLPAATASTLGGIKLGPGLSIDGDGVVTASGSGSTAVCDPGDHTIMCMIEEFMTGTVTSSQIGTHGWKWSALSSGTLAGLNVGNNSITNHPGVYVITSTTTANSGGVLSMGNGSTTSVTNLSDLLSKEWESNFIFRLDSVTDVRVRIGVSSDTTNLTPASGNVAFILRYDTDASYSDNTKNTVGSWVAQFCGYNGGNCNLSETAGVTTSLNIQPDTNWHKGRIYRSGTTINFQIDANTPTTMCASGCDMTLPNVTQLTLGLANYMSFGISSTTQRKVWVDWSMFKMTGLTRY